MCCLACHRVAPGLDPLALFGALLAGQSLKEMSDNRGEHLLKQRSAHDGKHDLAGKILRGDDGARRDIAHAAGKAHGGRLAIRQVQRAGDQNADDKAADGEGQNKEGDFQAHRIHV